MRHALSSTQNRQIKIIELLRTTNSYVSVKKNSENSGCGSKNNCK